MYLKCRKIILRRSKNHYPNLNMKYKLLYAFIAFVFVGPFCTSSKSIANVSSISVKLQDTSALGVLYGKNINSIGTEQLLTMDIYYPKNAVEGKTYPMVMLMHGGGFLTGSKENMAGPCKQLADSGFVAVTINYRKGWNAASRIGGCEGVDVTGLMLANYRALQDAHAALRFLAGNAKKYHINPDWMFVGGSSAGAVTALNVVYLNKEYAAQKFGEAVSSLGSIDRVTNSYTNDFKIKGICNMWGALPDSTLITKDNALPIILYHGTADNTVPYDEGPYISGCNNLPKLYGSANIYRQTIAAGKPAVLNTAIGGKHGPVEHTRTIMMSNAACFFHKIIAGKAQSAAYTIVKPGCGE